LENPWLPQEISHIYSVVARLLGNPPDAGKSNLAVTVALRKISSKVLSQDARVEKENINARIRPKPNPPVSGPYHSRSKERGLDRETTSVLNNNYFSY
jgi:Cdc6-like AAA superfamily ATPase